MARRATTDRRTIKSGITFLDTSDCYGPDTNEVLLGKVLSLCARARACTFHLLIYWMAALIFPTASSTTMYSRNEGLTKASVVNIRTSDRHSAGKRAFDFDLQFIP
ncbi:hypothetical protein RHMOL_Rhmol11G0142000 [Rhododendron molle]|uniref:Uncharacterized protein n=1 Tax=Rhododendron molle TaxID=49168 RepID=A0ACC0LS78_RHOML|nr:hypothetical protein RHMOL_Rhmol11G0142000 [Rhododendron molle]